MWTASPGLPRSYNYGHAYIGKVENFLGELVFFKTYTTVAILIASLCVLVTVVDPLPSTKLHEERHIYSVKCAYGVPLLVSDGVDTVTRVPRPSSIWCHTAEAGFARTNNLAVLYQYNPGLGFACANDLTRVALALTRYLGLGLSRHKSNKH